VVEEIFLTCDLQEIKQFAGMAQRLWLRRNELLHDGQFRHPNVLVQQTVTTIEDFDRANRLASPRNNEGAQWELIRWRRPLIRWVKVNWDTSVSKQQGRMGLGVVICDEKREFIAA
jgi:hypothetical protein